MGFFNNERKKHFMNKISKSYEKQCINIFNVSYFIEQKYNKDIYEFNIKELEELFKALESKAIRTARSRFIIITQYITFYMYLRNDKKNPLHEFSPSWADQFINSDRRLISENELNDILKKIPNAQDKVVYRLIFEGIDGKKHSELINLKIEDIDWGTNTLKVIDLERGSRYVKVTDLCMSLLREAIEQPYYKVIKNRNFDGPFFEGDEDFVIKRHGRHNKGDRTGMIINGKIRILKELSGMKDITASVLFYSGMARMAINVSRRKNIPVRELGFGENWTEIANRFNQRPRKHGADGSSIYYMNAFNNIDPEMVHELYGELEDYRIEDFVLVDESGIEKETVERKRRIDSPNFREIVLEAYNYTCAITGVKAEKFPEILEACHIQPYINEKSNHIQNSIILRADFHILFDKGYITIDENYIVRVSNLIDSDYYQSYNGKKIILPSDPLFYPSREALIHNQKTFRSYGLCSHTDEIVRKKISSFSNETNQSQNSDELNTKQKVKELANDLR